MVGERERGREGERERERERERARERVGLGGQGPLAPSPRLLRSPCPSCPEAPQPQHLTVASSCGISDEFRIGSWGESFTQGLKGFWYADTLRGV